VDVGKLEQLSDDIDEVNPHVKSAIVQGDSNSPNRHAKPSHRDRALAYSTVGTPG